MKNIVKKSIMAVFLALAMVTAGLSSAFADADITINLKDGAATDVSGFIFKIWKIEDEVKAGDIQKRDELDKLSDEELTGLYGKAIAEPVSDKDGLIRLSGLKNGSYFAKGELVSIEKGRYASFIFTVPLEKGEDTIYPKFEKPADSGKVILKKTDEHAGALEGVEFELYKKTPTGDVKVLVDGKTTFVTDKDGRIVIEGLALGDYYFKETGTKEGYTPLKGKLSFTLDESNKSETINLYAVNSKTPPKKIVKLVKVDDAGNFLKGVGFQLWMKTPSGDVQVPLTANSYDPNGKLMTIYTDADGFIEITNLPEGDYYWKEVEPLKGYQIIDEDTSFTLKGEKGAVVVVTNKKLPPPEKDHRLKKISDTGDRLEGVGFELWMKTPDGDKQVPIKDGKYDESAKPEILYTDKNGEIVVIGLPEGDYYWKELLPLAGYEIIVEKTGFKVLKNQGSESLVRNTKKPHGEYRFEKVDQNGKPLEGACFVVKRKLGDSFEEVIKDGKSYTVVSGKDGKFVVEDLPYGDYYLFETQAPKGYQPLAEGVSFTIDRDSKNRIQKVKNKLKGRITIPKTGDITLLVMTLAGSLIAGVGFKLTKED